MTFPGEFFSELYCYWPQKLTNLPMASLLKSYLSDDTTVDLILDTAVCANSLKFMICFVVSDFGFGGTAGASQTGVGVLGGLTGGLTAGQPAVDATAAAIAQQNQQQLLQLTSSPYGDSPLFRNLRQVRQFRAHDFFFYFKWCMYHSGLHLAIGLSLWQARRSGTHYRLSFVICLSVLVTRRTLKMMLFARY